MPTTSQPAQSGSAIHQHQGQHNQQHYKHQHQQQKQQNVFNLDLLFQRSVLFWQNQVSQQQNCFDFKIAESSVLESFTWTGFWLLIFSNLCAKWWGRQFQPHHSLIQRLIRCRFSAKCDEKEKWSWMFGCFTNCLISRPFLQKSLLTHTMMSKVITLMSLPEWVSVQTSLRGKLGEIYLGISEQMNIRWAQWAIVSSD